jgi:hypothetical protein
MRAGIVVDVTRADRRRLEAIIADRSAPQKHVWRANIASQTAVRPVGNVSVGVRAAHVGPHSARARRINGDRAAQFSRENCDDGVERRF